MYIYLDESGDLGFNFSNKSPSTHFVITILVCDDKQTFLGFKSAIKHTLNKKLNSKKSKNFANELKSTTTTFEMKRYFLENLNNKMYGNWRLYSIILNKKDVLKKWVNIQNQNRTYNTLSHIILSHVDFTKANQHIHLTVDLCKVRKERKIFNQYLTNNLETKLPISIGLDIRHEFSHNNAGLQAVDLFCSGIARKYTVGDKRWYDCFKHKIISEIMYEP